MPPDTLEFEEPIAMLMKEIEALSLMPQTPERERSIESLNKRIESIRAEIYQRLTPWQRVLVARHPQRPTVLDYVNRLFTEFTEISGDRRVAFDIEVTDADRRLRVKVDVNAQIRVRPSERLVSEVEKICGAGSVSLR